MEMTRIAAAVPRVHLADVDANKKEILSLLEKAAANGAHLVVFPELAVIGATCGDLVFQEILMDKAADACAEIRNRAAELGITVVLDESDYPSDENIIIVQDAAPEIVTSYRYLRRELSDSSKGRVIVYCSAGYGESTTDGVCSGAAMIFKDEYLLAENERFRTESSIVFADLREEGTKVPEFEACPVGRHPFVPEDKDELAARCGEAFSIQVTGLMSRLEHIGAKKVVLGISGGLDSTLALLVCCKAFDRLRIPRSGIVAVTMPGFGTTDRTHDNAWKLMEGLGVDIREIPIGPAVLQHFSDIGHPTDVHDAAYENAQARERTQILMDLANMERGIVVGTGDLSELALGWATYNGDHMSMYAVNGDVPKTMVQAIVRWAAGGEFKNVGNILIDIIDTPISPELLPGQQTEDLVGPYELHDFFLYYFVRHGMRPSEILKLAVKEFEGVYDAGTIEKWLRTFIRRFFSQQFKRSCLCDGPRIGTVCLSPRGAWTMPSDANATAWLDDLK